jgi:putative hemolysin
MNAEQGFLTLDPDNHNAKSFILESLEICAHNHSFSRKLLRRLSSATGPMYAIVGERITVNVLKDHDFTTTTPDGEDTGLRPTEIMVSIVGDYLGKTKDAVVMCENWAACRSDIAKWPWPPPRVTCYGDSEVYHVLTHEITDPEHIEAAIAPRHHWQTGVCSSCVHVPDGDIPDERFLDEIVRNTKYLFLPAFDGDGFLLWSPT